MKISDFVKVEIEHILAESNFTKEEEELFLLRTKDVPLEQCAELLNVSVSTVKRVNKRIKLKIDKVIE